MRVVGHGNEVEVTGVSDFDLVKTFECGQCFRWDIEENCLNVEGEVSYIGVAHGRVARVRQCCESVFISASIEDFETTWRGYFDLDRDYAQIRKQLCLDDFMRSATEYGEGIRILRQDKWEALCSFIISQNNNIPRIKSIVNKLCREFGDEIKFEGRSFYTFPCAERLAVLTADSLASLRCGYRAEYIIRAAKTIAEGTVNLDAISHESPDVARAALKKLHGVGDKVADCVLLFGLHMLDAFPVDVWMKKAVAKHYGSTFNPSIFTPYAGIAQQYIFHYMRTNGL